MLTSDVRPSSWQKTKKKKTFGGWRRKKRCTKEEKVQEVKTAFDRVLLESKPRDKFESLEMHLFFF